MQRCARIQIQAISKIEFFEKVVTIIIINLGTLLVVGQYVAIVRHRTAVPPDAVPLQRLVEQEASKGSINANRDMLEQLLDSEYSFGVWREGTKFEIVLSTLPWAQGRVVDVLGGAEWRRAEERGVLFQNTRDSEDRAVERKWVVESWKQ